MNKYHQISIVKPLIIIFSIIFIVGCAQNYFFGGGAEVDTTLPLVSITSHLNGSWDKAQFTISGQCSDNVAVTKVKINLINKDASGVESVAKDWDATIGENTWSKYFDLTADLGKVVGYKTFDIYAYDAAGNTANTRILLGVTNKMSLVTITNPRPEYLLSDYSKFDDLSRDDYNDMRFFSNKTIYIQGKTQTQLLPDKSITLTLYDSVDLNTIVYQSTILETNNAINTINWSFPIETDKAPFIDGHKYKIKLTPKDQSNIEWSQSSFGYFYVLQSSDEPRSHIKAPINGKTIFPSSTASINCWDDDGLKTIYWFVGRNTITPPADYTTWASLTQTTYQKSGVINPDASPDIYNFTQTTPSDVGEYNLYVKAIDINNLVGSTKSISFIQTSSDFPVVTLNSPDQAVIQKGNVIINIDANGGTGKQATKISYRVSSTKPADSGWIDKTDFTPAYTVNYNIPFDSNVYTTDTIHDIKVEIMCTNNGFANSVILTAYYKADNTPPVLSITNPGTGSTVFNTINLQGTATDWSSIKALYYGYFPAMDNATMIANYATEAQLDTNKVDYPAAATYNKWYKVSTPSTNWTYNYDTKIISNGSGLDPINPFNLYLAAVDYLGNLKYISTNYLLNQDADRPTVNVTQPAYTGSATSPWTTVSSMDKYSSSFLLMGTAYHIVGVQKVQFELYLMSYTGSSESIINRIKPSDGTTKNLTDPSDDAIGTNNWSYSLKNLPVCPSISGVPTRYYKVIPYVTSVTGRIAKGASSYFVISDQIPIIEILSPINLDPHGDSRWNTNISAQEIVSDPFGTIISNLKDDMYWDGIANNNYIYMKYNGNYSDSDTNQTHYEGRYFWGWKVSGGKTIKQYLDPGNTGIPYIDSLGNGVTDGDFNESTMGIFSGSAIDATRSNYYRMIFKSRIPPTVPSKIDKVEISYDGGTTYEVAILRNGSILESQNTAKYAAVEEQQGDGNTWFYANIDTSVLGTSRIIKIKVTDDLKPIPYFSESSLSLTFDNSNPNTSIEGWGKSDGSNTTDMNLNTSKPYMWGTANAPGGSGIRYARIFMWNNQGTPQTPSYAFSSNAAGRVQAVVPSGTYYVQIPDDLRESNLTASVIKPNGTGTDPNYLLIGKMFTPQNWRISDIYAESYQKYVANPIDGKKLVIIETVNNVGLKAYAFKELNFSQYPPSIGTTSMTWQSQSQNMTTSGLTSDRMWISNALTMSGSVIDNTDFDPKPGISRIRIYIKSEDGLTNYATWGTDTGEITAPGIGTTTSSNINWNLSSRTLSSINGGVDSDYLMILEIMDLTGVTITNNQYLYIDNTLPTNSFTQPGTAGQIVKGDSFTISGNTTQSLSKYYGSCVKVEIVESSTVLGNVVLDGSGNWSQSWDLNSTGFNGLPDDTVRTIRVTLTDRALNATNITRTVTKKTSPSWNTFTVNGNSAHFTYKTFADLYLDSIPVGATGTPVFLTNYLPATTNITIASSVSDSPDFTNAYVYLSGLQQDNTSYGSTTSSYAQYTTYSGPMVSTSNTISSLSDGEYTYRAQLFQGTSEINKRDYFIVDNQKPHIWIMETQNSDYVTSGTTKYGHIDAQLNATGYTANTDAVSGVITIYVKAQDNYLLKNVQMKMTNYNFGGGADTWMDIIARDASTNEWNAPASRGSLGDLNYFNVTKQPSSPLAVDKDFVYLKIEFNTAYITSVARLAQNLEFRCFDMATNESVSGDASVSSPVPELGQPNPTPSTPSPGYQKLARKTVDVVPYITNITRSMDTERTKYGKFIVRQAETGLTISGYNLANVGTTWVRVYTDASGAVAYADVTGFTPNATYTSYTGTSLASVTHSGWLRVAVNNIEAINNINTNTRDTNKENDITNPKWWSDADWNDDRYLWVWETGVTFNQSGEPEYPAMVMNASGTLYGSWSIYSDLYAYWGTTSNRYQIAGGYGTHYDQTEWTDIVIGGTNPNDAHVVYLNNMQAIGTWGDLRTYDYNNGTPSDAIVESLGDNNGNYNDGIDDKLFQFQNPRIALNGDENYISYYDSFSKCLKYAVTTNATATYVTSNSTAHNEYTVVDGADDYVAPPGNTNGNDEGLWNDILIDSYGGADVATPRPVIIYYSTADNTLKIARANGNPTVARPDNSTEWNKGYVFDATDDNRLYSGYYVSAKMDSSGNIYATCYRNSTGDLIYLYAPNIDGNGTYNFYASEVVDRNGAVGAWCDIYLVGTTPYISYHNTSMISTFYGLKCAYKVGSNWEYGVVPLNTFVTNKRTSVVASAGSIEGRTADVAIGYASNYFEITFLKREE